MAESSVKKGDRVLLRPGSRADVFDLALAGRTAVVSSIEQDLEGRRYVAVIVDDDPGVAIGPRRPGHRFYFSEAEVEVLGPADIAAKVERPRSILVAGIGNIFLGDDGFGVEVAQRLARRAVPEGVRIADYGIRGFDLAYALLDDPDHVILVDACRRGDPPGTVYLIEPDLTPLPDGAAEPFVVDAHTMNPFNVLRLAQSMGAPLRHVLLVGCEPATLGPNEGLLGLSEPVTRAIDQAISVVEAVLERLRTAGSLEESTNPQKGLPSRDELPTEAPPPR